MTFESAMGEEQTDISVGGRFKKSKIMKKYILIYFT